MGPLWEATRDLHHACEAHPVGAAMASGKPPAEWYAKWLKVLHTIHSVVDPTISPTIRRVDVIEQDLGKYEEQPGENSAALTYAQSLLTPDAIAGAAYVLTGAHLMGGEVMRRRLDGYPTAHLTWESRGAALAELKAYRERDGIAEPARACFAALLAAMDEIERG